MNTELGALEVGSTRCKDILVETSRLFLNRVLKGGIHHPHVRSQLGDIDTSLVLTLLLTAMLH